MGHAHPDVIRADAHGEDDEGVEEVVHRTLPRRNAAFGGEDEQAQHEAQHQRGPPRRQAERNPQRVGDQHRDAARDARREHRLGLQELVYFGALHLYGFFISTRMRSASCFGSTSNLCSAVYAGTDRPAITLSGEPVVESLWSRNVPSCPTVKLGVPTHATSREVGKRTTTYSPACAPLMPSWTWMIASCHWGSCSLIRVRCAGAPPPPPPPARPAAPVPRGPRPPSPLSECAPSEPHRSSRAWPSPPLLARPPPRPGNAPARGRLRVPPPLARRSSRSCRKSPGFPVSASRAARFAR